MVQESINHLVFVNLSFEIFDIVFKNAIAIKLFNILGSRFFKQLSQTIK